MNLTTRERALYADVWSGLDTYGEMSPGEKCLPLLLQMVGDQRGLALDAGCGSGKGALALRSVGFDVHCCDLTDEGLSEAAQEFLFTPTSLWNLPTIWTDQFDLAYCCDVMEHIPTQMTARVAAELLRVAPRVFFSIANTPDQFGAWVGQPLHQTIQPFSWWKELLNEVGRVTDARDLMGESVFLVERR